MARPTTKTPAELLAELDKRRDAILAQAAKAKVSQNPLLARLQNTRDTVAKDINALSRKMTGPNSFANRKLSIALRSAWIEAEEKQTIAQDALFRLQKDYLDSEMVRLGKLETVSEEDIENVARNMPTDDNLPALIAECELARIAFRDFTGSKNANDKADTVETPAPNASEGV